MTRPARSPVLVSLDNLPISPAEFSASATAPLSKEVTNLKIKVALLESQNIEQVHKIARLESENAQYECSIARFERETARRVRTRRKIEARLRLAEWIEAQRVGLAPSLPVRSPLRSTGTESPVLSPSAPLTFGVASLRALFEALTLSTSTAEQSQTTTLSDSTSQPGMGAQTPSSPTTESSFTVSSLMLPSPAIQIHPDTTAFRTAPSERQLVFVDFQDDEFPSSEQITERPVASTDESAIVPEAEEEDEDASSDDEDEQLPPGSSIYNKTMLFIMFLMAILRICYYVSTLMEMGCGILADPVQGAVIA